LSSKVITNNSHSLSDEPSPSPPEHLNKSPTKSLTKVAASPTKSFKQMLTNVTSASSPPLPSSQPLPTTKSLDSSNSDQIVVINKVKLPVEFTQESLDSGKISPVKKISSLNTEQIINTSTTTTTSGVSQLSSLDQSSVSANTNHLLQSNNSNSNTNPNNNNNISMITMTQSDSFNVSSSGYNGSISCVGGNVSSFMGGNVDMSMDSVVDKFNDELVFASLFFLNAYKYFVANKITQKIEMISL